MAKPTNLWQLLCASADRTRLMRACGVSEQTIKNGSDFDRFFAYANCMPLCQGHAILQADANLIEELLGVFVPINPKTAAALWHAAAYAMTGQGEIPLIPEVFEMDFVAPAEQTICGIDLGQAMYAMPTPELLMRLVNSEVQAICIKSQIESFVKPNPYTARRLWEMEREALTTVERDHLSAQTLRVLGKLCADRGSVLYVESDFAATDAWRAMLAYLQQSGCLTQIVLMVRNEDALRAAARLAGCLPNPINLPTVRVGVTDGALLELYQTLLPIGLVPPIIDQ